MNRWINQPMDSTFAESTTPFWSVVSPRPSKEIRKEAFGESITTTSREIPSCPSNRKESRNFTPVGASLRTLRYLLLYRNFGIEYVNKGCYTRKGDYRCGEKSLSPINDDDAAVAAPPVPPPPPVVWPENRWKDIKPKLHCLFSSNQLKTALGS